jgi:hypothetical protein
MTKNSQLDLAQDHASWVHSVARSTQGGTLLGWHVAAKQSLDTILASPDAIRGVADQAISSCTNGSNSNDAETLALADGLRDSLLGLQQRLGMDRPDFLTQVCARVGLQNAGNSSLSEDLPVTATDGLAPNGLLWLDSLAADHLESIGKSGEAFAKQIRIDAAKRWLQFQRLQLELGIPESTSIANEQARAERLFKLWLPQGSSRTPKIYSALGDVIWTDLVEPRLNVQRQKNQPALCFQVHQDIQRVMTTGGRVDLVQGVLFDRRGNQVTEIERKPETTYQIPALDIQRAEALIIRGGERLGSLTSHRLMRWEIRTGHAQALEGVADPRRISIVGGWEELAQRSGCGASHKNADDIRAILHAQAHLCFSFGKNQRGNLITYTFTPESRIRRAEIAIVLGDALLPNFVLTDMRGSSRRVRELRRLVPIVDLPPFVGRPNDHGPQASFQAQLVAELRKRAVELVQRGGVLLTPEDMVKMAEAVELPRILLPKVLDRWRHDGDDGPSFLQLIDRDRYTLADAHAPAREFLKQSGNSEVKGAASGRKSVQSRKRQYRRTAAP